MGLQRLYSDGPFLHPAMKIKYAVQILASTLAFACAPAVRGTERPQPVPDIDTTPPIASGISTWTISPTHEQHRYRSITSTLLELADTTGITRDSITTTIDFTLSILRDREPLSYSATVESMSARGGQKTGITTNAELPFSFTARLERGRIIMDLPEGQASQSYADCSKDALSTTAAIQRAVLALPLVLHKDMVWTDSTTRNSCSGSIPVTSTTVRRYRVVGETSASRSGVLIERQDRTTLSGEGSQGQHRVRLKSDGSGTTQVIIDAQTGAVLESTGAHTASVVVTASGRDQRFTQTTREQVRRLELVLN